MAETPGVAPRGSIVVPQEVREVADELIEALGDDLAALLWHGSWARGEQTPESDHDLIVVLRRLNEDVLARMQAVFEDRPGWSTFIKTEEEIRNYPITGRLQFHHGAVPLYGSIQPPPITREGLAEDLRQLAVDIQHECRYRLVHGSSRTLAGMDAEFIRVRNARWMYYQAKLAILALKSREMLGGREYPLTRTELRARLTDADEIAAVDVVQNWAAEKAGYEEDFRPLALLLDKVMRGLVAKLGQ